MSLSNRFLLLFFSMLSLYLLQSPHFCSAQSPIELSTASPFGFDSLQRKHPDKKSIDDQAQTLARKIYGLKDTNSITHAPYIIPGGTKTQTINQLATEYSNLLTVPPTENLGCHFEFDPPAAKRKSLKADRGCFTMTSNILVPKDKAQSLLQKKGALQKTAAEIVYEMALRSWYSPHDNVAFVDFENFVYKNYQNNQCDSQLEETTSSPRKRKDYLMGPSKKYDRSESFVRSCYKVSLNVWADPTCDLFHTQEVTADKNKGLFVWAAHLVLPQNKCEHEKNATTSTTSTIFVEETAQKDIFLQQKMQVCIEPDKAPSKYRDYYKENLDLFFDYQNESRDYSCTDSDSGYQSFIATLDVNNRPFAPRIEDNVLATKGATAIQ